MHFATRAIHASQPSDPSTGALIAPIYQTSTFEQESPGVNLGFDYSRTNNPTRARLEEVLAELEGVSHCAVFASGLAAEHAILQAYLKPRDQVVVPLDVYGGTYRLLHRVFAAFDLTITPVDTTRLDAVADGDYRSDAAGVARDADQPSLAGVGHSCHRGARACQGRAGRGRQHLCHAGVSATLHARRRCRGAQRHEISRRAFRSDPGGGAREGRRGVRADQIPAERHRRSTGAARLLVDAARSQDAGTARLASRRECGAHCRCPRRPAPCASCVLPWPHHSPRARRGAPANDRVRRDAVL